jgi:hypothetical protein
VAIALQVVAALGYEADSKTFSALLVAETNAPPPRTTLPAEHDAVAVI